MYQDNIFVLERSLKEEQGKVQISFATNKSLHHQILSNDKTHEGLNQIIDNLEGELVKVKEANEKLECDNKQMADRGNIGQQDLEALQTQVTNMNANTQVRMRNDN